MEKQVKYTNVKRCVRCQQPWEGWGLWCNQCITIDAINKQTEANKPLSESSSSSSTPMAEFITTCSPALIVAGWLFGFGFWNSFFVVVGVCIFFSILEYLKIYSKQ